MATRTFGFLNATRQYLKSLAAQAIGLPSYGTLIQWDNFIRILSPRPTNASMIQPRNLAAYYANDPTALILDGSNNVILWEDWSGNSSTNCLCLDGVVGNYASLADAPPLQVIGDIDIRANIAPNDWTPVTRKSVVQKWNGVVNQRGFALSLEATGVLTLQTSFTGTSVSTTDTSTIAPTITDLMPLWVRSTRVAATGITRFYTSSDGQNWNQLGADVQGIPGNIFACTSQLEIGSQGLGTIGVFLGRVYRSVLYNGIQETGGTLVCDADFSKATKLATSFTESSPLAATVIINSTAVFNAARVAGERDLYQGLAASRPAYTSANGRNRLVVTFDGTDDFMKALSFNTTQPETFYLVTSQLTWTVNDTLLDGYTSASQFRLYQNLSSPTINFSTDNANFVGPNSTWPIAERAIISVVANGVSSSLQVNRRAINSGPAGSSSGLGLILGTNAGAVAYANIAVSELALYSSDAHNAQTRANIIGYFANKYSIGL